MAFDWFSHPDSKIGWIPPYPQWREKFTLNDRQAENLLDDGEELGEVKPTFNLDQLSTLYTIATNQERMYLLFGVCLGWTAREIATLKRSKIKEADGEMFIEKKRSKTGVVQTFWVFGAGGSLGWLKLPMFPVGRCVFVDLFAMLLSFRLLRLWFFGWRLFRT